MLKNDSTKSRSRMLLALVAAMALAAMVLAGCASGGSSSGSSSAAATSSAAAGAEATAEATIDASAYDALIASGPVADDADIAASTWATAIKDAGKIRVGGVSTSTLFALENEVDGKIRGFDAGIYQLLTRYILGDEGAYELTKVTSDTRESVLQNDQVDLVFATYTITEDRAKLISFAGPYYTSQYAIMVTEANSDITGLSDLAGKTVAVQSGSTGPTVMEEFAPEATLEEFTTDEEARQALEDGRVDAYVYDYSMHLGSIVKNPGKYKVVGGTFGPDDPYGVGLPLDSDGVAFVNDFLKKIEESGLWADLWKVSIGDRTNVSEAPAPPAIS